MVNSNFYGLDAILVHPTTVQSARAANITYGALMFRRAIERQYLEPVRRCLVACIFLERYFAQSSLSHFVGGTSNNLCHFVDNDPRPGAALLMAIRKSVQHYQAAW